MGKVRSTSQIRHFEEFHEVLEVNLIEKLAHKT